MENADLSASVAKHIPSDHPDAEMEAHMYVHDYNDVNIFYDRPFQKTLSWIELDATSGKIDFILEDGNIRNFGFHIDLKLIPYLSQTKSISMVLRDNLTPIDETILPLIVHGEK